MQHLAWSRGARPRGLRVVDVELRFAIAPITVVLEKGWRELGQRGTSEQEAAEQWQTQHPVPLFCPMPQDQEHDHDHEQELIAAGVANPAVIDLFGVDGKTDEVV